MLKKSLLLSTIVFATSLLMNGVSSPAVATTMQKPTLKSPKSEHLAQSNTHRVRLGDTLWGISRRYRINMGMLVNLNPKLRSRPNLIYVGETLYVRGVGRSTSTSTARPQDRAKPKPPVVVKPRYQYKPQPPARPTPQPVAVQPRPQPNPVTVKPKPQPVATQPRQNSRRLTTFNLPSERRTFKDRIGADRGGISCTQNKQDSMRTLLPDNNFGWTLYDYPQFFWYSPALEAESIESTDVYFTLGIVERKEDNGVIEEKLGEDPLYEAQLTQLQKRRSEIVSFTLPPDADPLEEGQEYEWEVLVECPAGNHISIQGRIKRLSTENPELSSKLENATIEEYPSILAEAGVWYDALQIMTGLMRDNPEDDIFQQDWQNVLKLIEFKESSDLPIQYIEPQFEENIGQY
ncbi:DUF928 domain-containing protein [Waterburya agarophytonicola]|nr:DUF928 domain-containing protein [Waterburya agarophytonicola]